MSIRLFVSWQKLQFTKCVFKHIKSSWTFTGVFRGIKWTAVYPEINRVELLGTPTRPHLLVCVDYMICLPCLGPDWMASWIAWCITLPCQRTPLSQGLGVEWIRVLGGVRVKRQVCDEHVRPLLTLGAFSPGTWGLVSQVVACSLKSEQHAKTCRRNSDACQAC